LELKLAWVPLERKKFVLLPLAQTIDQSSELLMKKICAATASFALETEVEERFSQD
jgi:hypothetical protein